MREQVLIEDLIIELSSIHRQLNDIMLEGFLKPIKINIEPSRRGNKSLTLGRFWGDAEWKDDTPQQITIFTLGLNGDYRSVISILVHEMAHQYNHMKDIKDVENNQRHNRKFRDAALKLGLEVAPFNPRYGFAQTSLSPELTKIIDDKLDFNRKALEIKHAHAVDIDQRGYSKRKVYTCGCEDVRVVNSRDTPLNIKCLDCGKKFQVKEKSFKNKS